MSNNHKASAAEIKIALAKKHSRDFFLTEVKSGSTYAGTGNRILDGVALRLSYTSPYITGYEVKVSRSDFLGDNKFYTYLPLVHALYIVTPCGLIQREELPTEVGLMWYDPEDKTLKIKKKPPPRDIEISRDMLLYIIYSRMDSDRIPFYSSTAEYFKDWLENKRTNETLAMFIRSKIASELSRLESELRAANRFERGAAREQYKQIMECLEKHGMPSWEQDPAKWIENELRRPYPRVLDDIRFSADIIVKKIEDAKQRANKTMEES